MKGYRFLVLAAIFKQSIFFQILFQKCKCSCKYSCSPTLSQISLKNFIGKVVFQILVTWLFSRNETLFCFVLFLFCFVLFLFLFLFLFFAAILKSNIFEFPFCWFMVVLSVYRYGASFVPKFLRKVPKNEWVQVDPPPPCAQTGVKSSLCT